MSEASEKIHKRAEELIELFGTATVVTVGGVKLCDFGELQALLAERTEMEGQIESMKMIFDMVKHSADRAEKARDEYGAALDAYHELQRLDVIPEDAIPDCDFSPGNHAREARIVVDLICDALGYARPKWDPLPPPPEPV